MAAATSPEVLIAAPRAVRFEDMNSPSTSQQRSIECSPTVPIHVALAQNSAASESDDEDDEIDNVAMASPTVPVAGMDLAQYDDDEDEDKESDMPSQSRPNPVQNSPFNTSAKNAPVQNSPFNTSAKNAPVQNSPLSSAVVVESKREVVTIQVQEDEQEEEEEYFRSDPSPCSDDEFDDDNDGEEHTPAAKTPVSRQIFESTKADALSSAMRKAWNVDVISSNDSSPAAVIGEHDKTQLWNAAVFASPAPIDSPTHSSTPLSTRKSQKTVRIAELVNDSANDDVDDEEESDVSATIFLSYLKTTHLFIVLVFVNSM